MPRRLVLLHGDNGSGKTTILRLLWNLLSHADDRGHRTYLAKTPFRELHVKFHDDSSLRVQKKKGLVGTYDVTLDRKGGLRKITTTYEAGADLRVRGNRFGDVDSAVLEEFLRLEEAALYQANIGKVLQSDLALKTLEKRRSGERAYLEFLRSIVKTPLFLADDRSLYSDDPEINRTRDLLARREESERRDKLTRLVFLELQVTIRRVNDVLRRLTLGGQNDGSANSYAIYASVLRELVGQPPSDGRPPSEIPRSALAELDEIAQISPSFERYELVPRFDVDEYRTLLQRVSDTELSDIAERVVSPFLSSVRARFDALREAHTLLDALVPTINAFLRDKRVVYTTRDGLQIVTIDGKTLDATSLSSGERQLLMLLCTTLLASMDARLFFIDEPELSLGVEWQRQILGALLGLTEGSGLQFFIATHSIEIISGHAESLVPLREI